MISSTDPKLQSLFVVPQENELLSSWLIRLALNSKLHSTEYFSLLGNYKGIWYCDIDRSAGIDFYQFLSKIYPYSTNEIQELSLMSLTGKLYEQDNPKGINKWIRQLSFIGRKPMSPHLVYCPLCLVEPNAYFKKLWRTKIINTCVKCGIYLIDKCPHCSMPIHFFRNGVGNKKTFEFKITNCSYCFKNICDTKIIDAPHRIIDSTLIIEETINSGIQKPFNYSFIYFDSLYQIYKAILLHFRHEQINTTLIQAKIIHICTWLIDEFPENIVIFSKNRKISKTPWLKDFSTDRFLFTNEITKHLSKLRLTQFD